MTGFKKVSSKISPKFWSLISSYPTSLCFLSTATSSEKGWKITSVTCFYVMAYLTQPAGICLISLEMPKEVIELGQDKPFVICQQEMFSGLIPVRSVMIVLIMCVEGKEWIFWQDVRWSPLYNRLNFWVFYPYYLIQCDVCGIHKYLSIDSMWEKEIFKNGYLFEYGDFNH